MSETSDFIEQNGISWPTGYGANDLLNELGVTALPTKIVVGADGKVAWHSMLGRGSLDAAIAEALQNANSPGTES